MREYCTSLIGLYTATSCEVSRHKGPLETATVYLVKVAKGLQCVYVYVYSLVYARPRYIQ